jgi:hypothetical protein
MAIEFLGHVSARSKASFGFYSFSTFSTTWGICFSLKGKPSGFNERGFVTVLPRYDRSATVTDVGFA